jgi:transposase
MTVKTLCIGIDVHLDDLVVRAVDQTDGHEVLERFRVTNNLPGCQTALTTLAQTATQHGYTRLQIGWEATGLLWLPFHQQLCGSPMLQAFEVQPVCFNPKLVAHFKDGLVLRHPKNDERDAWDVAARLRLGELPVSYVPGDFWQGLRRLTRYRYHLARDLVREELRFRAHAFLKCSDWQRVKPFANLYGATSLALLTEFTVAELKAMSALELADRIAHRGRGRFDDPAATAHAVQDALRTSYPIDPQLDALLTATLALSAEHLRMIQRLIKRLDQQIARAIAPFPNPLLTVKGLGPVITAGLLAEIVDITRFPDDPQLAQYLGLTWEQRATGRFVAQNTRLTKVGNVYLRYYTILGADRLRQFNLEYQAYYQRKYQEVPKHQHKRALVLTARKLVRLIHALLTKNVPYVVRPQTPHAAEGGHAVA